MGTQLRIEGGGYLSGTTTTSEERLQCCRTTLYRWVEGSEGRSYEGSG